MDSLENKVNKENIVKKVPVILPIRFKEGTIKIKQESKEGRCYNKRRYN